jgi:hypothetical protein
MSLKDKIEELANGETQLRNWLNGLEGANDAQKAAIAEWAESAEAGDGGGFWKAYDSVEGQEAPVEEEAPAEKLPNNQASSISKPAGYSGYPTRI